MDKDVPGSDAQNPGLAYLLWPYSGGVRVAGTYWGPLPEAGIHCPECSSVLDHTRVSSHVKMRAKRDIASADGRVIVSARFRNFCEAAGYPDLEFHEVDARRKLFEMRPTRLLYVDIDRSAPIFTGQCWRCGNIDCLHGRGFFFHDLTKPLDRGFFRSDLLWGCRAGKHPRIVVGEETKRQLSEARFSVRFDALPDLDPNFERRLAANRASEIRSRVRQTSSRRGAAFLWRA